MLSFNCLGLHCVATLNNIAGMKITNFNMLLFWFIFPWRLTGREPLVFLPGPISNEAPTGKAHLKQCEQMTLTRRQKRLCRREPGLAETLRESVRLSLSECRYQFRNERWNCSLDGRGSLLKRGESLKDLVFNTWSARVFSRRIQSAAYTFVFTKCIAYL